MKDRRMVSAQGARAAVADLSDSCVQTNGSVAVSNRLAATLTTEPLVIATAPAARPARLLAISLLLTIAAGAAAGAQASRDDAPLVTPAPSGPHAVGRRLLHWTDESRREPTDTARARELMVWMWYPAASADGERERALPEGWAETHERESARKIGAEAAAALRALRVQARTGAPLLPGVGALPVLLFFPGLGWLPGDYSTLAEDLASHGYVVFGVAPTGLAATVQFPDGRQVPQLLGAGPRIGEDQVHAHEDARFALDEIRRLNGATASGLAGRLDLARIGAFGHSLGGTTALVLAARDTSVRAALNVDGDPMGGVRDVRPRQPILLLSSESPPIEEFPQAADSQRLALVRAGLERSEQRRTGEWVAIAERSTRAERLHVAGARHSDFLDVALVEARITDPKLRWMRVGPIAGERALRITRDVVRAFFDRELRSAPGDLLAEPGRAYPELGR